MVDTVYEVEGLGEALTAAGVSQSDFAREAGVAAAYAWRTASGANTRVRGRNAEKYMDALERLGILVSEEG